MQGGTSGKGKRERRGREGSKAAGHLLTDIAAIDSVPHHRSQLDGDASLVLNGKIADALPCIKDMLPDKRARRTCHHALGALAATCPALLHHVHWKRNCSEDLSKEEARTNFRT
eukprot:755913-Hanusia_phi.AAC.3